MNTADAPDYQALSSEYEILYNSRDLMCLFENLFMEDYGIEPVFVSQILTEIELKLNLLEKLMDAE
jgi:hypothetical protein